MIHQNWIKSFFARTLTKSPSVNDTMGFQLSTLRRLFQSERVKYRNSHFVLHFSMTITIFDCSIDWNHLIVLSSLFSIDCFPDIFSNLLKNSNLIDEEQSRLGNFFKQLRNRIAIFVISNFATVEWNRDSSSVKLSCDLASSLAVLKTWLDPIHAESIRQKTLFLKILKYICSFTAVWNPANILFDCDNHWVEAKHNSE
jgi:hypothetical protein